MDNSILVESLLTYIKRRDLTSVDVLLNEGVDINCQDETTLETAMHAAVNACVVHKDPAYLQQIISRGATRVNDVNMNGCTPLHYSVNEHYPTVTHALLELGARTDVLNKAGVSVFQYPVSLNHVSVVLDLLAHKGDCNLLNGRNQSLLHTALEADHQGIVDILLQYQLHLDTSDVDGFSPLYWSIYHNHEALARQIIQACGSHIADKENKHGEFLLHCASERGHIGLMHMLLEEFDCDVNKVNIYNETALMYACRANQLKACEVQLERCESLETISCVSSITQNSCLHEAVRLKNAPMVEQLQQHHCNGTYKNKEGLTPWLYACRQGSIDLLYVLSRYSLQEQDNHQSTKLAIESSQYHIVKYQLDQNADMYKHGISLCIATGDTDILELLLEHKCVPSYEDVQYACREGEEEILSLQLEYRQGVCLNRLFHDLQSSKEEVGMEIYTILLDSGQSVQHSDQLGNTMLHEAAKTAPSKQFFFIQDKAPVQWEMLNTHGQSVEDVLEQYDRSLILEILRDE